MVVEAKDLEVVEEGEEVVMAATMEASVVVNCRSSSSESRRWW